MSHSGNPFLKVPISPIEGHEANPFLGAPAGRKWGHMPVASAAGGPTASFSVAHPSSGGGNYKPVNFTDLSTPSAFPIASWHWDLGDGTTSTLQNPTHTYALTGTYNVILAVTDAGGATATCVGVLRVPRAPIAFFSYTHRYHTANLVDLSNDDTAIVGWLWNFGGGHTSTLQNPSYDFGADGTYSVTLTVTDEDGLTGTVTANVTVTNLAPVAAFSFRETALAVSFFDASSDDSDGLTYAWDFGDSVTSSIPSPTHVYAADGTYTASLTITDLGGLTSNITHSVTVAATKVNLTLLELSSDTTDGTQMTTGLLSPTPGAAVYVHLVTARGGTLVTPTMTGLSTSWTQISSWTFTDAGGNVRRGTTWVGQDPGMTAGVILFDTGSQLATSWIWAVVEARNIALSVGGGYAQHIGAVTYWGPGSQWTTVDGKFPTVSLSIINPASGPGPSPDATWHSTTVSAQGAGLKVLGYVHTSYGARPIADCKAEVDSYYSWYDVDGIFFDEVTNTTGATELAYYLALYNYVKAKTSARSKTVVINPGGETDVAYATRADIIMVTEAGSAAEYLGRSTVAWELSAAPGSLWHVVYDCPEGQLDAVIAQSRTLNAGIVWFTDDILPNPYDIIPSYFSSEATKVATGGGDVLTGAAAATAQVVASTNGTAGTTITNTLAALAAANSVHLAFVALDTHASVTPDADFAELGDHSEVTGNVTLEVQFAANQTDVTPTFAGAAVGVTSIEVRGK